MKTFKGFEKGTSDGGFEKASKYLLEKLGYDNDYIVAGFMGNVMMA